MATLTIRNLPEQTKRALKERAAKNDRSMEAEVRDILQAAAGQSDDGWAVAWQSATQRLRGDDYVIPERSDAARDISFG